MSWRIGTAESLLYYSLPLLFLICIMFYFCGALSNCSLCGDTCSKREFSSHESTWCYRFFTHTVLTCLSSGPEFQRKRLDMGREANQIIHRHLTGCSWVWQSPFLCNDTSAREVMIVGVAVVIVIIRPKLPRWKACFILNGWSRLELLKSNKIHLK